MATKLVSLGDFVRGGQPQAPQKRQRRAAKPVEPAGPASPLAAPGVSSLFVGLAGIESAAASLRAGIEAIGKAQMQPAPAIPPPVTPSGDGRISYRLSEAAKALGVSAKVLRREVAAGKIPHRACGRITIISKAALDAYARGEAKTREG